MQGGFAPQREETLQVSRKYSLSVAPQQEASSTGSCVLPSMLQQRYVRAA